MCVSFSVLQVGVGLVGNFFIMCSNALLFYFYPNRTESNSTSGWEQVNLCVGLCAFFGFLSGLPVGWLGNALLEHKIMVWVGVANVCINLFVQSILLSPIYCDMLSFLCRADHDSPRAILTGSASSMACLCVCAAILLMSISMNLLAWPMHARYITHAACMLFTLSLTHSTPLTELGHDLEFYLTVAACFLGETIGFTMQRASRRQFLQRTHEAHENASRMADMLKRNEQLACEKERLNYEIKLRPISRYAHPPTMTSESNMSNDGTQRTLLTILHASRLTALSHVHVHPSCMCMWMSPPLTSPPHPHQNIPTTTRSSTVLVTHSVRRAHWLYGQLFLRLRSRHQ